MESLPGQRAKPEEVRALLRHVRAARLGARSRLALPPCLAGYAQQPAGVVATRLAGAVARLHVDPRGRDAAVRYYGLIRLPEQLQDVARTLPGLGRGRIGLTRHQTRNLIRMVEGALATELPPRPGPAGQAFAKPTEPSWPPEGWLSRQQILERVMASGASGPAAGRLQEALALYHAERDRVAADVAAPPRSRWQQYRLRRLAWAAIDACLPVAWQPAAGDWRRRPAPSAHGLLGPHVFVEVADLDADEAACLDGFLRHDRTDLDSLRLLLAAIHRYRARSADVAWTLLGLLRAQLLQRLARHPDRATLALYAEALTVYVAIAREREDVAGITAARIVLGPLTAVEDLLRCHVTIDASILQTAHGDLPGASATLERQLLQVQAGRLPKVERLRWQRDLTLALSGVRLRQLQAGGSRELIAEGIRLVQAAQDCPLPTNDGWLSSTFRRAADLLVAGAEQAARAGDISGQHRQLSRAGRWMEAGERFADTGSGDWQLQWQLGMARMAELRGDREGFLAYWERAVGFDVELRRFPGQALKLAQLQRRGQVRWHLDLPLPKDVLMLRPRLSPRAPRARHHAVERLLSRPSVNPDGSSLG